MNKMLVAVFNNTAAAHAGLYALQGLHAQGDITLYASGLIAKDAQGHVTLSERGSQGPVGAGIGLAVGSLMGLLAAPIGVAVGAAAGTLAGVIRDFWVTGVGLDFIEEADTHLRAGKVALVAEIEEERVAQVDAALTEAGGIVFRRSRAHVIESRFHHDIRAVEGEIKELQAEAKHASGTAKARLQDQLDETRASLGVVAESARQNVEALKDEAASKTASLKQQLNDATGDAQARIETRLQHVHDAYHDRASKLAQAWELTMDALRTGR